MLEKKFRRLKGFAYKSLGRIRKKKKVEIAKNLFFLNAWYQRGKVYNID